MPASCSSISDVRISRVLNALSLIAIGDADKVRLDVTSGDKFGTVEEMLNLLAAAYSTVTRRQKEHIQALEGLLGIVSHDLRSPVAALLATSQSISRRASLPESLRPAFERMVRAAVRIQAISNTILNYSEAELQGELTLDVRPGTLRHIVKQACEKASIQYPGHTITTDFQGNMKGSFDHDRVQQALILMLGSAMEHGSPDHPVHLTVRGEFNEFVIQVQGSSPPSPVPAVPLSVRNAILDSPLADSHQSTVQISRGLGLFLVRLIALAHGGSFEIEPLPQGQTRTILRLPRDAKTLQQPAFHHPADTAEQDELTVMWQAFHGVLEAFSWFPGMSEHLFNKVHLVVSHTSSGKWAIAPDEVVPLRKVLAFMQEMRRLVGEQGLIKGGAFMPAKAIFPPHVHDIRSGLMSIDVAYHMNHQKAGKPMFNPETGEMLEGIGHYQCQLAEDQPLARFLVTSVYPCEFDRGIVLGMARRYEPLAELQHLGTDCRNLGSTKCHYLVTW